MEGRVRKEGKYASHHPVRDETDSSTYTTTEEEGGRGGFDVCVQLYHEITS